MIRPASGFRPAAAILALTLATLAISVSHSGRAAELWRGLTIAPEHRCTPYNRALYPYPQSVERKIVASMDGRIYGPYTGRYFRNTRQTDIEHIVAVSEAHDSGLCSATAASNGAALPPTRSISPSPLRKLTAAVRAANAPTTPATGCRPTTNAGSPLALSPSSKNTNSPSTVPKRPPSTAFSAPAPRPKSSTAPNRVPPATSGQRLSPPAPPTRFNSTTTTATAA